VSYDPVVAEAARAAARQLAPQYGPRAEAEVEAALRAGGEDGPPRQFNDWVAIGSLIVSAAALAWQVYRDLKKPDEKPTQDAVTRRARVEWRKETDLTSGAEKIIEIVTAEIIERDR
jgi:hypothetical protein